MSGQRVLYISHRSPFAVNNGASQRSNLIFRALSSEFQCDYVHVIGPRGAVGPTLPVTTLHIRDFSREWPWKLLKPLGPNAIDKIAWNVRGVHRRFELEPKLGDAIGALIESGSYSCVVSQLVSFSSRYGLHGRGTIVDVDDLETEVYRSELQTDPKWHRRWIASRNLKKVEKILPKMLDAFGLLWISNAEHRERVGLSGAITLPNIPYTAPEASHHRNLPFDIDSRRILVVAGNHRPKVEGINWFLREVWPKLLGRVNGVTLRIVGSTFTQSQLGVWRKIRGVEAIGRVDNIEAEYRHSRFALVPIHSGSGTNIKLLEALGYGRTCVTTDHGLRGYRDHLRHDEHLLVARDVDETLEYCFALLQNSALCVRLAKAGKQVVDTNFSYDIFREIVVSSVRSQFN